MACAATGQKFDPRLYNRNGPFFQIGACNQTYQVNVDLGNDTTLCSGENIMLNAATLNANYMWQDNSIASAFIVTQPGIYHVTVNDNCGIASDTLTVSQSVCNCDLFVPNSFTPNGDNLNDRFFLHLIVSFLNII